MADEDEGSEELAAEVTEDLSARITALETAVSALSARIFDSEALAWHNTSPGGGSGGDDEAADREEEEEDEGQGGV
jgi:hypothetical protein